jgi:hypothetical protein
MSGKVKMVESGFFSGFLTVWLKAITHREVLEIFSICALVKMRAYDCNSKWHR